MHRDRLIWAMGVVVLLLAIPSTVAVARVLPFGYDFRAYWLAAEHLRQGTVIYPGLEAPLGQPDEFHYLPQVALPFMVFLPLQIYDAARVWLGIELVVCAIVAYVLIHPLPNAARPWALAGFVFFLPTVLEVTLGNVDMICVALALLAWHWRHRSYAPVAPFAAAVGIKFLPVILLPFYVAAGYWRTALRAFAFGLAVLLATSPFVWRPKFFELIPRFLDSTWVRLHVQREAPTWLGNIVWDDNFPLALALLTAAVAIAFGINARRDREHETDWHHMALALSPYVVPFGWTWTTFLIASLPLFSLTLRRVLRLDPLPRGAGIAGLAACWFAMQLVGLGDLLPMAAHMVGVVGLVAISIAALALEQRQMLGRSMPLVRATSIASG